MKIIMCIILVFALTGCDNSDKTLDESQNVEANATLNNNDMVVELNNNDYALNNQFIEDSNVLNISLYKDVNLSIETKDVFIMDTIDDNINLDKYEIFIDMMEHFGDKAKVISQKLKITNKSDKKIEYQINHFSLFKVTKKNADGKNVVDIVENEKFYQIENNVSAKEKECISVEKGETKEVIIYYVTIEELKENDEIYFEASDSNYIFDNNKLVLSITKEIQFLKINMNFLTTEGR